MLRLRPLTPEIMAFADSAVHMPDQQYSEAVWLPISGGLGIARIDNWRNPVYTSHSNLFRQAEHLRWLRWNSPLGGVLQRLGVTAVSNVGAGVEMVEVCFQPVQDLSAGIDELNAKLPENHKLPRVLPHPSGEYSNRRFMEMYIRPDGGVMMSTGEAEYPTERQQTARLAIHDIAAHFGPTLMTPPAFRERVRHRFAEALKASPITAAPEIITPARKLMRAYDTCITPDGVGAVLETDRAHSVIPGIAELLGFNLAQTNQMAQAIGEHVAYLGEQFPLQP